MSILETRLLHDSDDALARAILIKHRKGSLETPAYALGIQYLNSTLIYRGGLSGILELSLTFRTKQLYRMHEDVLAQERLERRVNRYLSRAPEDHLIVALPLLDGERGEELSSKNAPFYGTYIAQLVANPGIDIVCTPVFLRISEAYLDLFLESFLETMSSYRVGVALSIPYASRQTWEKLIKVFLKNVDTNPRALVNFLCVDYNGSNPFYRYVLHNYVLNYAKVLEEELGEHVVIYGANLKYSRVASKYKEVSARDLASFFTYVDIMGDNHKRMVLDGQVAENIRVEESVWKQKILHRGEYVYYNLDALAGNPETTVEGTEPILELIKQHASSHQVKRLVKQVNTRTKLVETSILRQLFKGRGWLNFDRPIDYLSSKKAVKTDLSILDKIKKYTKLYKTKIQTLDQYM